MKIQLVIQGPLLSVGKTGKEDGVTVKYDCRPNVDRIIDYNERFGIFSNIVLCVWEDDIYADYDNQGVRKIRLPNNFKNATYRRSNGSVTINNKERQFYSSLQGCEELLKLGAKSTDLVLKLRTDQIFEFCILNDFVGSLDEKHLNKIFVPFLSHKTKAGMPAPKVHMSDYYILGKLRVLRNFFNVQLEENEMTESIHRDAFFRYAWSCFGEDLGVDFKYYFTKIGKIFEQHAEVVEKTYRELFYPLPKQCYDTLEWRGEATINNGRTDKHIYHDDWCEHKFRNAYLQTIRKSRAKVNKLNFAYVIDYDKYWCLQNAASVRSIVWRPLLMLHEKIGRVYNLLGRVVKKKRAEFVRIADSGRDGKISLLNVGSAGSLQQKYKGNPPEK